MCSTEMSAEKILALVLSIMCWSACRTLSRMRERGDRMSGAVATTLPVQRGRRWLETEDELEQNPLVRAGEFRPSPLFEEHQQERGHHGAQAQAGHRRGCCELRGREGGVVQSDRKQSRAGKRRQQEKCWFLTAALVPSRTSMKSFSLVASSDRCITSD